MRFVPIDSVKEGMILAKPLLGKKGELLLQKGAVIFPSYIKRIKQLGYNGIFIDDNLSREVIFPEVVDENLKIEAVRALKSAFAKIGQCSCSSPEVYNDLYNTVNDIVDSILESKDALVSIIDLKSFDDYTFYHCVNVCILSIVIGKALGFNKSRLYNLGLSAVLHDIGKTFIPKQILNKNGRLTDEEFDIIKTHSSWGYRYVRTNIRIPSSAYIGILHHHERFDGTGYPMGIKSDKISLFGRVISVADVYDALISERPYRKALPHFEAFEYVMGNGKTAFDPEIVKVFSKRVAPYPVGTSVILSNNKTGLVVENHADCATRPKVKIYKHGDADVKPYYIDLKNDKDTMDVVIIGVV